MKIVAVPLLLWIISSPLICRCQLGFSRTDMFSTGQGISVPRTRLFESTIDRDIASTFAHSAPKPTWQGSTVSSLSNMNGLDSSDFSNPYPKPASHPPSRSSTSDNSAFQGQSSIFSSASFNQSPEEISKIHFQSSPSFPEGSSLTPAASPNWNRNSNTTAVRSTPENSRNFYDQTSDELKVFSLANRGSTPITSRNFNTSDNFGRSVAPSTSGNFGNSGSSITLLEPNNQNLSNISSRSGASNVLNTFNKPTISNGTASPSISSNSYLPSSSSPYGMKTISGEPKTLSVNAYSNNSSTYGMQNDFDEPKTMNAYGYSNTSGIYGMRDGSGESKLLNANGHSSSSIPLQNMNINSSPTIPNTIISPSVYGTSRSSGRPTLDDENVARNGIPLPNMNTNRTKASQNTIISHSAYGTSRSSPRPTLEDENRARSGNSLHNIYMNRPTTGQSTMASPSLYSVSRSSARLTLEDENIAQSGTALSNMTTNTTTSNKNTNVSPSVNGRSRSTARPRLEDENIARSSTPLPSMPMNKTNTIQNTNISSSVYGRSRSGPRERVEDESIARSGISLPSMPMNRNNKSQNTNLSPSVYGRSRSGSRPILGDENAARSGIPLSNVHTNRTTANKNTNISPSAYSSSRSSARQTSEDENAERSGRTRSVEDPFTASNWGSLSTLPENLHYSSVNYTVPKEINTRVFTSLTSPEYQSARDGSKISSSNQGYKTSQTEGMGSKAISSTPIITTNTTSPYTYSNAQYGQILQNTTVNSLNSFGTAVPVSSPGATFGRGNNVMGESNHNSLDMGGNQSTGHLISVKKEEATSGGTGFWDLSSYFPDIKLTILPGSTSHSNDGTNELNENTMTSDRGSTLDDENVSVNPQSSNAIGVLFKVPIEQEFIDNTKPRIVETRTFADENDPAVKEFLRKSQTGKSGNKESKKDENIKQTPAESSHESETPSLVDQNVDSEKFSVTSDNEKKEAYATTQNHQQAPLEKDYKRSKDLNTEKKVESSVPVNETNTTGTNVLSAASSVTGSAISKKYDATENKHTGKKSQNLWDNDPKITKPLHLNRNNMRVQDASSIIGNTEKGNSVVRPYDIENIGVVHLQRHKTVEGNQVHRASDEPEFGQNTKAKDDTLSAIRNIISNDLSEVSNVGSGLQAMTYKRADIETASRSKGERRPTGIEKIPEEYFVGSGVFPENNDVPKRRAQPTTLSSSAGTATLTSSFPVMTPSLSGSRPPPSNNYVMPGRSTYFYGASYNPFAEPVAEDYGDSPYTTYMWSENPFPDPYSTHSRLENYGMLYTNRYYHDVRIPSNVPWEDYVKRKKEREEAKKYQIKQDEGYPVNGVIAGTSDPPPRGIITTDRKYPVVLTLEEAKYKPPSRPNYPGKVRKSSPK